MADYYGDLEGATRFVESLPGPCLGTPGMLRAMFETDAEAHLLDEWDCQPTMQFYALQLLQDPREAVMDPDGTVLVETAIEVGTMPLPEGGGEAIVRLIQRAAPMFVSFAEQEMPGQALGFGLTHEAWMVVSPKDENDPNTIEAMTAAAEHRLHAHPDSVEVRISVAVDRYGNCVMVTHRRTGELDVSVTAGLPEHDEGRLVDALRMLAERLA